MTTFHITHGDVGRTFSTVISDANGDAIDLTSDTVDFVIWLPNATAATIDAEATNDAETTGKSDYSIDDWSGITNPGLDKEALYKLVWRHTTSGGDVNTLPTPVNAHIVIIHGVP